MDWKNSLILAGFYVKIRSKSVIGFERIFELSFDLADDDDGCGGFADNRCRNVADTVVM